MPYINHHFSPSILKLLLLSFFQAFESLFSTARVFLPSSSSYLNFAVAAQYLNLAAAAELYFDRAQTEFVDERRRGEGGTEWRRKEYQRHLESCRRWSAAYTMCPLLPLNSEGWVRREDEVTEGNCKIQEGEAETESSHRCSRSLPLPSVAEFSVFKLAEFVILSPLSASPSLSASSSSSASPLLNVIILSERELRSIFGAQDRAERQR